MIWWRLWLLRFSMSATVRQRVVKALARVGRDAVAPLAALLQDGSPVLRQWAAYGLGEIAHVDAVEPLVAVLRDGRGADMERYAVTALEKTVTAVAKRGPDAVIPLATLLKNSDSLVREWAAKGLGEVTHVSAVDPLISVLKDDSAGVRRFAINALARIGDVCAVDSLLPGLEDRDSGVRNAAVEALEKIGDARALEGLKQYRAKLARQQEQDRAREQERLAREINLVFQCNCPRGWNPSLGKEDPAFAQPLNNALKAFARRYGTPSRIKFDISLEANTMYISFIAEANDPTQALEMKTFFDKELLYSGLRYGEEWK